MEGVIVGEFGSALTCNVRPEMAGGNASRFSGFSYFLRPLGMFCSKGFCMKRFSTVFLVLITVCLAYSYSGLSGVHAAEQLSSDDDYQMRKFIYEGSELLAAGETARALARFNSAKKIAPENPDCYYWIALAYSDLQNFGMAAKNAETAVGLNDSQAKNWLLWGQSLLYDGKYEDAAQKLAKAFQLEPENYLAAFNLGRCYYYGFQKESQRLNIATRFFQKALDLNPDFVPARYYLGCVQLDAGQLLLAITSLRWVIARDPQNIDAYYRLGLAYRRDNHIAQAEKAFMDVLSIDPGHYESRLQLGHIYLIDKPSRENAIKNFNAFLELAPANHPWRTRIEDLLKRDQKLEAKRRGEVGSANSGRAGGGN